MTRLETTIAAMTCGGATVIAAAAAGTGATLAPDRGAGFFGGALAVWAAFSFALWRGRRDNVPAGDASAAPLQTLTTATWITVGRAFLISGVAGFLLGPPLSQTSRWIAGGLYALAALGDGADGAWARRTGGSTPLGARLDVYTDALGLLVAPAVGVAWGLLPPWYLLLAAAFPLFRLGMWLRTRLRLPVFPEYLRPDPRARFFAGVQMFVVAAALLPVLPRPLMWALATAAMLPTLALFWGEWRAVIGRSSGTGRALAHADTQRQHA